MKYENLKSILAIEEELTEKESCVGSLPSNEEVYAALKVPELVPPENAVPSDTPAVIVGPSEHEFGILNINNLVISIWISEDNKGNSFKIWCLTWTAIRKDQNQQK